MRIFVPLFQALGLLFPRSKSDFLKAPQKKATNPHREPLGTRRVDLGTVLLLMLCGGILIACGRQQENAGDSQHLNLRAGRDVDSEKPFSREFIQILDPLPPTRFPHASPADWVQLTPKEIEHELKGDSFRDGYLPPEGPETRRVQTLLDEIYDHLATSTPERFVSKLGNFSIPRPIIRIRNSQSVNASVVRLRVCRGGTILFPGTGKSLSNPGNKIFIASIDSRGGLGLFERHEVDCVERLSDPLGADDLAHALDDDLPKEKCSWTIASEGLAINPSCLTKNPNLPTQASGLLLTTTTNLITITTGALKQFDDKDDLRFTLAHELAHYLYAHGSLTKSGYNYFYRQNRRNFIFPRPEPDTSLKEIGDKAAKLPSFRTQPIEGQKMHSEMFPYFRDAMKRIIEPLCADFTTQCHTDCAGLRKIVEQSHNLADFGRFPQAKLTPRALSLYWEYEKEFPICAKSIPILTEGTQPSAVAVSKEAASRIFWNAKTDNKANLQDLAAEMNQNFFIKEASQNEILASALTNRVGYFTTEEEADNLALEWSQIFGIVAAKMFVYWVDYAYSMRARDQDADLSYGYERCADFFQTYASEIYDDQAPLVPIGSYSDAHHSLCYRAYRTAKRLEARYNTPLDPSVIRDAFSQHEENQTMPSGTLY